MSLADLSGMNPHSVIADSNQSAVVGPETNANKTGASSGEDVASAESSPAQVTAHRDEPVEPDKWLRIQHLASNREQASAAAIRGAATTRVSGKAVSANTTVPVTQKPAKDAWPLTLDEIIKQTLVRLLRETAGNRRRTASVLGISRSTLYRMLARYGIDHVGREATPRKPRVDPAVAPLPSVPTA